ncbi:DNA repair protein REV1 [Teleopsis dalmanni]|uniref:DNA repair protein REV1 n=1 Tax=Teleopsis dalmanni TaxID=139649 RepID=UPI0018CE39A8|nr:DNA repair protein REV1 [Teleopsis dalmanni]
MSREINNGFDEWGGYMEAKITKLEEQFNTASNPFKQSNLFSGISVFVNGLTNPSSNEIKQIMMVHGGIFHHYERSHTTFIIASNLPDVKVRNMNTSKVIKPQWVVDCIKEKRILDYTPYLLCTNQKTSQPSLPFPKLNVDSQRNCNKKMNMSSRINSTIQNVHKNPSSINCNNLNDNIINKTESENTVTARSAVDPKFLAEFYNNSRLHHIATLGAGFKQYISTLRENHKNKVFPARNTLKEKLLLQRKLPEDQENEKLVSCIMHIDIDCFFVSVGLKKHPHLRGQPVAVTHSKGGSNAMDIQIHPDSNRKLEAELFTQRFEKHLHNNILSDKVRNGFDSKMSLSEIASCSYEARKKGLHNGMFVGHALQLCPELKTIPYDFDAYKEVAYTLYNTITQYTLNIEAVSCDEMFVDLVDILKEIKASPMEFVQEIRNEIKQKTGCPCSAGIGANKLQARMATKSAKPDGQYYLEAKDVKTYMTNILIKDLPGVGSCTNYTLEKVNLLTCGHLQEISLQTIQKHVGKKFGETLYQFCRGIDNRQLIYEQIRKSVSAEVNYGIRFTEYSEVDNFLRQLCSEIHSRLIAINRKSKCITLKVMVRAKDAPIETSKFMGHGVCDNITKSVSLSAFTNDLKTITQTILTTMKALSISPNELRGIGIQLTKLDGQTDDKTPSENIIKNMFQKLSEKAKLNVTSKTCPKTPNLVSIEPKKEQDNHLNRKRKLLKNQNNAKNLPESANKKKALLKPCDINMLPPHIDPLTFSELPSSIQEEILREISYSTPSHTYNSNNTLKCDTIRTSETKFCESNSTEPKKTKSELHIENIFAQQNCTQLLLAWVKSGEKPESYDVNLISEHAAEFVRSKQIDKLYVFLTYLQRLINNKKTINSNSLWHVAFRNIVNSINAEMGNVYEGRKLVILENQDVYHMFSCGKVKFDL